MSRNEEWCGVCGNEIPNFGISKCTCNKRDPVNCNHYMEVPSYSCSCPETCGCWEGTCKRLWKGNVAKEHERKLNLETYTRNRIGGSYCVRCQNNNCTCGKYTNCIRHGKLLRYADSMRCIECARQIDRDHKIQDQAKYDAAFLNEGNKMINQSHNDEELARTFYNVATKLGIPRLPEGKYGSGEKGVFEDLSLRDVKLMAQFVRELRK
jgi:hypothetical protein